MWLLQVPTKLSSPFLNGSTVVWKGNSGVGVGVSVSVSVSVRQRPCEIKAMKSMQGKVVCATNDKTVAVEVVRLAPHPKYKRRERKKKKYQAHDPDNQFKVGDIVQLQKTRPISKTKAFLALPIPKRPSNNPDPSPSPLLT